jgi:hypothetical protein
MQEIKREKRRLDDLLTIREAELEKYKGMDKESIEELEKKIKHMEKKHEKQI